MNQESINPKSLAVCIFGNQGQSFDQQHHTDQLREKFKDFANINLFYCVETEDIYFNMFKASFLKRNYEIKHSINFDLVLTVDLNKFALIQFVPISKCTNEETLYFLRGGFYTHWSSTVIWPEIFCASSMISDFAAKFGQVYKILPKGRKGACLEEDFYYYLKSLKIRTVAMNKDIPSLFNIKQHGGQSL